MQPVQGEPAGACGAGRLEGEGELTREEYIVAVNLRQFLGQGAASHATCSAESTGRATLVWGTDYIAYLLNIMMPGD